jgi:broad specificity phosphatase PhoE
MNCLKLFNHKSTGGKLKMKKWIMGFLLLGVVLTGCGQGSITKATQSEPKQEQSSEITLYFVRHGKTMLNTVDRSQGWIDAPLTPAGIEVAEQLGNGLKEIKFDHVVTSDSGRAIETAELILKNSGQSALIKDMVRDKRLREYNFGTYEGQMNEEMISAVAKAEGKSYEEYVAWGEEVGFYNEIIQFADTLAKLDQQNTDSQSNWPAEDSQTIIKRLNESLAEIVKTAESNKAKNVLVVSHGMSLITLLGQLEPDAELPKAGLKNASVQKVAYKDGHYSVKSVNDLSYVEKGKQNQ